MRVAMTMIAICGMFTMLLPQYSEAVEAAIPCTAEPTDMTMHYGEIIQCAIGPNAGESDIFRFAGRDGQHVVIVVTSFDIFPCIDLYAPNNSLLVQSCGGNAVRLGAPSFVLPVSGTYRLRVYSRDSFYTGQYNLSLERVKPPANSAQPICYNQLPIETEALNLLGDLDVFTFSAGVDDKVQITVSSNNITPCVELFAPDGTRVATDCGNTAQITPLLTRRGSYTILISARAHDEVDPYILTLLCTSGPCEATCPLCPQCGGLDATICGTDDNDTLMGTAGNDVIVGKGGDDVIYGRGGNDIICGNEGNDILFGGNGGDQLFGGTGSDALFGEAGNDRLDGEGGHDVLYGGLGRDRLSGGTGNDLLFGGADNDTLSGGSGTDICDNIADTTAALSCEILVNP